MSNLDGSAPKTPEMLRYEYARSALLVGLEVEAATGVNPYDFGFNGTSDAHTGLPSTGEENYFGKMATSEPSPIRMDRDVIPAATGVADHHGAGIGRRPDRGLGAREHAGRDLRLADAEGDLCDDRHAPAGASLCRVGFPAGR